MDHTRGRGPEDLALRTGENFSEAPPFENSDGTVHIGMGKITFYYNSETNATNWCVSWPFMNFSMDQVYGISTRALHLLVRVAGCDLGYTVRQELRGQFSQYVSRGWWREHLDSDLIWADIMIHTKQFDDAIHESLDDLAQALAAMNFFGQAADMYAYSRVEHSAGLTSELARLAT